MVLMLQAAPLLLLVGLLLSGRAGPVPACLAALALAVPAAIVSLPEGIPGLTFLAAQVPRGVFLAVQPILVLTGGLMFHAAVARDAGPPPDRPPDPRRVFVATLLAGAFVESVTGFAVGAVFAVAALRAMGLRGAPAGALALLALTLVPWGCLGPGTALGAALIGVPAQQLAQDTAWPNALWLLCLGPVCWRLCTSAGIVVPLRERVAQMLLLAIEAALLLLANQLLPFELAGMVAAGLPLLWALWRLDPPRDTAAWQRAARLLAPWATLTVALLLARSWIAAPAWRPFAELPGFGVTHVAVVLWAVTLPLLLRREDAGAAAGGALRRAARPALAMLLYVVLARLMAGSGAAAALAQGAAAAMGPLAPFAVPPLGLLSGIVTGSNVGSNSALLAVQAALGEAAGLPARLAPALHNFAGSAGAGMSFANTALVCGLLADGTRPPALWRLLAPSMAAVLLIGWAAVAWFG